MKRSETSILLTKVAAFDQRTIGEADVEAWTEALGPSIPLADALVVVTEHFRTSHERLMPIHIITAVGGVRRERLQRAGDPPMPGGLTWQQEKAWRQLWCAAVKDGETRDDAARTASDAMQLGPANELVGMPAEVRAAITRFATEHAVPAVTS
jgi:hypothetical protein